MRTLALVVLLLACAFEGTLQAQQADFAFGLGGIKSKSGFGSISADHSPQTVGGGVYPTFSGDVLLRHHLGINGEVAWRATRGLYQGVLPFRPIFYDFNGIWVPQLGKTVGAEFLAGIGAESIRVYAGTIQCGFTGCTNYVSNSHFMGHLAAGLRLYPWGSFFIRPEVHVYLVHNNVDFSSGYATRYGVSFGYTFGH